MIDIKSLTKKYDSRGIAGIHGISLQLERGQVFSLLGPNGSGKTTLLRLLSGSIEPDSGDFHLDGEVVFFPREDSCPEMNVQKFLVNSVTLEIDEDKKIQLARDLADTFEFTFQLRQNLKDLSSGQRQKVLLARELINGPTLLLLDEPFAHLDPFMRKDILDSLFTYIRQKEMTVIWVSHDIEEALKFSDMLGLLNFGRFEQVDIPENFIRCPKNLFVAKFMGYNNFFPTDFKKGFWQTPWGPLAGKLEGKTQGLLVVPDAAWDEREGVVFRIIKRFPALQAIQYILEREGKIFVLQRSPTEQALNIGEEISLGLKQNDVFFIEL